MPRNLVKSAIACVFLVACVHHVPVTSYKYTISHMRASVANQIVTELEAQGYEVELWQSKASQQMGEGEEVREFTFTIQGGDYPLTSEAFLRITNKLRSTKRDDPIVLKSTLIEQVYESAAGSGLAEVKLKIDITRNACAYFKKTDRPIPVDRDTSGNYGWFSYSRSRNEEYVDVYFLPDGAPPGTRPKVFTRISLYAPYETQVLRWDPWWRRLFASLGESP